MGLKRTCLPKRKSLVIDAMKTMYKTLLSLLLLCLLGAVGKGQLFAQGLVNFTNLKPSKQIITDPEGNKLDGGCNYPTVAV